MSFRSLLRKMGARWLAGDVVTTPSGKTIETDSRILWPIMALFDAQRARLRYGMRARFPDYAPEDALTWIGDSLGILRGPEEASASYRSRLKQGIDAARKIGTAWVLLEELRGYCTPHAVRVRIVNNGGVWYTIDRDGTRSIYRGAWNWDGSGDEWSRVWVLIYPTTGSPKKPWDRPHHWGDVGLKWGDTDRTWGSNATPADVFAVRRIVRERKPAGSTCVSTIIVFDDLAFDPTATAPPNPDGTWKDHGRYGVVDGRKTPARNADAIYWQGTGATT